MSALGLGRVRETLNTYLHQLSVSSRGCRSAIEQPRARAPVERAPHSDGLSEAQRLAHRLLHAAGRRRREGHPGDGREPPAHARQSQVPRAEVVAPFGDAVRLIDSHHAEGAVALDGLRWRGRAAVRGARDGLSGARWGRLGRLPDLEAGAKGCRGEELRRDEDDSRGWAGRLDIAQNAVSFRSSPAVSQRLHGPSSCPLEC